jgi:ABC-type dipeptide/oligopeptide/nickel transport system permease subunit
LVPATLLVVLLMCFSLLGDALRDALDPRDR